MENAIAEIYIFHLEDIPENVTIVTDYDNHN